MIYLCKPCGLARDACGATCKCFNACCETGCKTIQETCRAGCNAFNFITHYPLGLYVMGSWITMAGVLVASGMSLKDIKSNSPACREARIFFAVNCGLAVVHSIAAYYIQRQIKAKINRDEHERDPEAPKDEDLAFDKDIPHSQVAKAATEIALYDFGFCLYFFLFFGSLGINVYGLGMVSGDCKGEEAYTGRAAAMVMILYGLGVANYFFCWYCMQACCGAKEKRQMKKKEAKSAGWWKKAGAVEENKGSSVAGGAASE